MLTRLRSTITLTLALSALPLAGQLPPAASRPQPEERTPEPEAAPETAEVARPQWDPPAGMVPKAIQPDPPVAPAPATMPTAAVAANAQSPSLRQSDPAPSGGAAAAQAPQRRPPASEPQQPWSPSLVTYLATAILVFGLGVLLLIVVLVRAGKQGHEVLKLVCVPLIVVAAVFLMVVGYDQDQLTPIIGLLGTIAGYLLGKGDGSAPVSSKS